MVINLTAIERRILDFMVLYLRTNTYQPSIREIGERFAIKSTKTVSEHLQALADKGYLERDPSRSRGVKILGVDLNAQTVSVPCYNELPEGRSGLRTDRAEAYLSMDRRLAGAKGCFFVQAKGNELGAIEVAEGDYLLVEPTAIDDVADDALVVARVGGRASYFRLSRNGQGVNLSPLDGSEGPTVVEEPAKLKLIGRVSALYRRLDGVPMLLSTTAH